MDFDIARLIYDGKNSHQNFAEFRLRLRLLTEKLINDTEW